MPLPKAVKRWAFYPFANHSYLVVYVSFILPIFFSTVLLAKGYSLSAWGLANGISTIVGVCIAVIIGRYSDVHGKLRSFNWSIFITAFFMFVLAFSAVYFVQGLYMLFIVTNSLFIWSLALSDSILPHISDKETAYEYGGYSWGFGYAGGIASLILVLVLQYFTGQYSLAVFISVPIFYIVFSVYCLAGLKNVPLDVGHESDRGDTIVIANRSKFILLIGFWLISECITVISLFASTYLSDELHFTLMQVGLAFLVVELIAFPATWYGGKLVKKYGSLRLLGLTVLMWGISIMTMVFFHVNMFGLTFVLILISLAYGNSQSYLRSQYATVTPKGKSGFEFGLYAIVSEAAVFIGPIAYGYASDKLHSQEYPLIALFMLMIVGYIFVWKVMRKFDRPSSSYVSTSLESSTQRSH